MKLPRQGYIVNNRVSGLWQLNLSSLTAQWGSKVPIVIGNLGFPHSNRSYGFV